MVEGVWKRQGMPKSIDKKVTAAFARELWGGVVKGYGKDLIGISYDSPDYEMLSHLQNNIYQFASAKNYSQLKALTQALIGEDGKLRSYSDFKQAAYEINEKHCNQWLKTEYNTAIASGQMASKWVQFQASKKTLSILEFDAIIDGRTTDLCRQLNGTRKSVDDPFWDIYYPPNHFWERSTVRQRSGGATTPDSQIDKPEIPSMFRANLAKQKLVFPKGHPYFTGLPEQTLLSFGDANYSLDTVRELKGKNGSVYESGLAFNPTKLSDVRYLKEYNMRKQVADTLADHFSKDVKILPELPANDWRYPLFFDKVPYKGKLPDLLVGKQYWEVKSYEAAFRYSKISHMLKKGSLQSNRIVMKLHHQVDMDYFRKRAVGSLKTSIWLKLIKEVLVIDMDNIVHVIK